MTELHAIDTSTSGSVSTVSLKIRSKGSYKGSNGAPLAHVHTHILGLVQGILHQLVGDLGN